MAPQGSSSENTTRVSGKVTSQIGHCYSHNHQDQKGRGGGQMGGEEIYCINYTRSPINEHYHQSIDIQNSSYA